MFQDLQFGIRTLLRQRTFTLAAILALALGIGANSAVFSVINTVLLRPLPYRDADGLLMVWGNFLKLGMERIGAKPAEYDDYRKQTEIFAETAAFNNFSATFAGTGDPQQIAGAKVTASLFPMLGARTVAGQLFSAENEQPGNDQVVVLSFGFWQRQFGKDTKLIGNSITLDGESRTVIGVLPAGFQFPHNGFAEPAELYVPLTFSAEQIAQRGGRWEHRVLARLKPGVALDQARVQMNTLAQAFEQNYPGYRGPNNADGGWRITVEPLQEMVVGKSRQSLLWLLAIVGLVLLIACANVANLLLARAVVRQKEIAVRLALGASRWRIIRQLLTESLLLATLGGSLGLLLAHWGIAALVNLNPASLPRVSEISLDGRVLAFTVAASLLTGLLFGLIPALQASRPNLPQTLKETNANLMSGRRFQLRQILVIVEVALTMVVLVCAGLVINSFVRLLNYTPGLNPNQVLTAAISLPATRYAERPQVAAFYDQLLSNVAALPGVESVGASSIVPLSGAAVDDPFSIEGRPLDMTRMTVAGHQSVSPDFFRALNINLLMGRNFTAADAAESPAVAIINETMAKTFWPEQSATAVGQKIKLGAPKAPGNWATIVGVVRDIPHRGLDSSPKPDWYLPQSQSPARTMTLFVRTKLDPASLTTAVRQEVRAIDPAQPLTNVSTMNEIVASSIAPRRFSMLLLTVFAAAALLLATTGVYSVMAYAVSERTREVGIRIALGAERADVIRLILKQGLTLTLIGVAAGLVGAFAAARAITNLLYGVKATDPLTFLTIALLLMFVALLACYLPARRAAKVDPVIALRHE